MLMRLTKQNKKQACSHSHKSLPNQYLSYHQNSRQFKKKLTCNLPKNKNPLYSLQSLKKYFFRKKTPKFKQPSDQLIMKKQKIDEKDSQIVKFKKLQQMLRKQRKQHSTKKLSNEILDFNTYAQQQFQHFENLNWDDGIYPLNQFSLHNFKFDHYIEQLQKPLPPSSRKCQKILAHKRRIHTENIVSFIKNEQLESRYRKIPYSVMKKQQKKQIQGQLPSCQHRNAELRSKTMHCSGQYQPLYLRKNIGKDKDVLGESRCYMKGKMKEILYERK